MAVDFTFPDLEDFCIDLTAFGDLRLLFPGGAEILAFIGDNVNSALDFVREVFKSINTALAPLKPIFDVLDVVIAIYNCITSLVNAVTSPTPENIAALSECPDRLGQAIQALFQLVPALSIPYMIVSFIDAFIAFVKALNLRIIAYLAQLARIVAAETAAADPGNFQLGPIVLCAKRNFSIEITNLNSSLGMLNRLIGIINFFCKLAGLPCIPSLDSIAEDALNTVAELLNTFVEILEYIRSLIPITPFPNFILGPVDKDCNPILTPP